MTQGRTQWLRAALGGEVGAVRDLKARGERADGECGRCGFSWKICIERGAGIMATDFV